MYDCEMNFKKSIFEYGKRKYTYFVIKNKPYKKLKQLALEMRARQMSYSQIKDATGVSKSTLSGWLKDKPLSREKNK